MTPMDPRPVPAHAQARPPEPRVGQTVNCEPDPDIATCPGCGGPADMGHTREVPPSPYLCSRCQELE